MEQAKLVGIGFMGKPDRVTRLLNRMMESTNRAYDLSAQGNDQVFLSDTRSVTGFYLGFTENGLNLSLFTKGIGPHSEKMNHRITYSMKQKKSSLH